MGSAGKSKVAVVGFRDLRVWQGAMDLVEEIYRLSQAFPQNEVYCLTAQLRRSAISVPSNIAEGHTREHLKEYLHHLSMAQASLAELQTQLEISGRLGYLSHAQLALALEHGASLAKQLYALRNALEKRQSPSPDADEGC